MHKGPISGNVAVIDFCKFPSFQSLFQCRVFAFLGQLSGREMRNVIRSRIFRIERVGEHFVIG